MNSNAPDSKSFDSEQYFESDASVIANQHQGSSGENATVLC